MKAVILGHSYYARENRKQLTAIANVLNSDLDVVLPRLTTAGGLFDYSADDIPTGGPGYRFHVLTSWPTGNHLRSMLTHLKPCLDRIRPDVVHCEWAPQTVPALQMTMLKRLRLANFVLTGTLRQPVVNFRQRWYGKILSSLTGWMLGEFDGLQVNTTLAEEAFFAAVNVETSLRPFLFPGYQTGVDTELFRPPSVAERSKAREVLGFDDHDIVVGYCGRFIERKGVLELLKGLALVRDGPTRAANVRVAMLGSGPLEEAMRRISANVDLPVSIFPVRPHAEVARFMWALDIFVLPSHVREKWVEHDAHVVVEAMACGIPVVGTTSGATKEILSDAGILVPPGEPTTLAQAITYLISNAEAAHSYGASGRKRACDSFSHKAVAANLVAAWDRLMRVDCG